MTTTTLPMPIDLTPTPPRDPAAMSDDAKRRHCIRRLLELTDEYGRGYFPLQMIAEGLELTNEQLYDNNTNTGLLWDLGRHGRAIIDVSVNGWDCACINVDRQREAEMFAREPGPSDEQSAPPDDLWSQLWDQALEGMAQPWHREAAAKIADYERTLRVIAENPGWADHACRAAAVLGKWAGRVGTTP